MSLKLLDWSTVHSLSVHCELIAARYFSISQPAGRPAKNHSPAGRPAGRPRSTPAGRPRSTAQPTTASAGRPAVRPASWLLLLLLLPVLLVHGRPAGRYLASRPAGCRRNSRPGCPRCPNVATKKLFISVNILRFYCRMNNGKVVQIFTTVSTLATNTFMVSYQGAIRDSIFS